MRTLVILAALGLCWRASVALPAHAICMGDGEYEQALADVQEREAVREPPTASAGGEAPSEAAGTETAAAAPSSPDTKAN